MSVIFRHLDCCQHICKRVTEGLGHNDFTSILSCLSIKKVDDSNYIGFRIPVKKIQTTLDIVNTSQLLDIKTDSTIHRIYADDGGNDVAFDIRKEDLMNSVLKLNLNTTKIENSPRGKHMLVEFSSPNIAKPFHMGHLRSTIIGNFVANILGANHNVKRLNYLGDWGTQIGFVKAGLEAAGVKDIIQLENPMREMSKAYSLANNDPNMADKAREIFLSLEKEPLAEWQDQWEKIRTITIDNLKKTYSSFGVYFDEYSYESKYRLANISYVIEHLKKHNFSFVENGCLVMDINGDKVPLLKSDGTTLYLLRDIAAALDRIKSNKIDQMVYVVDKSQSSHLNNLKFAMLKLTQKDIINHVPFGRITGMSTRKGTSIFLEDILNETVEKMAQQQLKSPNTRTSDPEVTKILGVTSLIIYILRQRRNRDFRFTWENAVQGTGDGGVKLQYTHSRLHSLEKRSGVKLPLEPDATVLKENLAFELVFELARFNEVVLASQEHLESSFLVSYSFKLCNLVSRCLKELPVKGQENHLAMQRLLLFHSAKNTIASAMKILGLQPLNEM